MLDFFQTVRHRHSVRRYQADMPLEDAQIHAILETAIAAPSAGDLQAYRIIAVRDSALRKALSEVANHQDFIAEAPVSLVFCTDPERSAVVYGERGRNLYALQDATISTAYAQLAAEAAGLGSTWVGDFDEAAVSGLLGLDGSLTPVAILAIGYPAERPEATPRQPIKDVVSYR